jgi:hypothetical protein
LAVAAFAVLRRSLFSLSFASRADKINRSNKRRFLFPNLCSTDFLERAPPRLISRFTEFAYFIFRFQNTRRKRKRIPALGREFSPLRKRR